MNLVWAWSCPSRTVRQLNGTLDNILQLSLGAASFQNTQHTVKPLNPNTVDVMECQAKLQIQLVSAELVLRSTSSLALLKTTSGLLSSANITLKNKQITSSSLLSTFIYFSRTCLGNSAGTGMLSGYSDADSCISENFNLISSLCWMHYSPNKKKQRSFLEVKYSFG